MPPPDYLYSSFVFIDIPGSFVQILIEKWRVKHCRLRGSVQPDESEEPPGKVDVMSLLNSKAISVSASDYLYSSFVFIDIPGSFV